MFFTRTTPWFFETDEGIVATHRNRLNEHLLEMLSAALDGAEVAEARIRTKALALDLELSNTSRLSLMPRRPAGEDDEVWALATPGGELVRALSSGTLDVIPNDEPVPWRDFPDQGGDTPVEDEMHSAVRARGRRLEYVEGDMHALLKALDQLVRRSGFGVYGPLLTPTSLADFVLLDPAGKVVLVEIKTPSRTIRPETRVPRVIVTVDPLSDEEQAVLEREPRSAVLPLTQVSTQAVADLVSRLAG